MIANKASTPTTIPKIAHPDNPLLELHVEFDASKVYPYWQNKQSSSLVQREHPGVEVPPHWKQVPAFIFSIDP